MEIKRYNGKWTFGNGLYEDINGEWVKYSDIEKLEEENEMLIETLRFYGDITKNGDAGIRARLTLEKIKQ